MSPTTRTFLRVFAASLVCCIGLLYFAVDWSLQERPDQRALLVFLTTAVSAAIASIFTRLIAKEQP